ncbi:hypothetical protein RvY_08140 [Ramazzottius varieornatus]|uniref:Uncharacterized protein n=1 Tax=Ramazzottius varieornatus TaxID=947166 RepID=A0A1D1V4W4_RAMVA|nr:hypothetical protein RvY_08140 [Ramazzottius varieornatus]
MNKLNPSHGFKLPPHAFPEDFKFVVEKFETSGLFSQM